MVEFLEILQMNSPLRSQIEIGPWEVFPSLVLIGLIVTGFVQAWKQTQGDYKKVQRYERSQLQLPLIIKTPVTQEFSVHTYDISLSGAFLSYDELKQSMAFTSLIGKRSGIKKGDLVDVCVVLGRFNRFNCQAKVVRYNFSDQSMPPKGIGIEFIKLSKRKKDMLKAIIEKRTEIQQAA